MRRAFFATLPRLASHRPLLLIHPGFPPLPPGLVNSSRMFEVIDIAYNEDGVIDLLKDGVIDLLKDEDGRVLGKRCWPPGTKEINLVEPRPQTLELSPELQEEEDTSLEEEQKRAWREERKGGAKKGAGRKALSLEKEAARMIWLEEEEEAAAKAVEGKLMRMAESRVDVPGGGSKGAKSTNAAWRGSKAGRKQ